LIDERDDRRASVDREVFMNGSVQILRESKNRNTIVSVRYRIEREKEAAVIPKVIVTEEQWIEAGIANFARNGLDGLVIEKMASALGCSKSSFYWYFDNRQHYIARIVERWVELSTLEIMQRPSGPGSADVQLTELLARMFSATRKGDFLFYFRKLAGDDPVFREKLETVERMRMQYAEGLIGRLGMDPAAAEQKAHLLYHYYLGWYERHKHCHMEDEQLERHIGMLRTQLLGL